MAGQDHSAAVGMDAAKAGSVFEAELAYLIGHGYLPNASGTFMLPP
jgi:hypothetical protein